MRKRQLISIVSAVLLAAHVSAGCCAHHEHKPDGSAFISLAHPHDHSHGHPHEHSPGHLHDHGHNHAHDHAAQHSDRDHSTPQHEHQPGDHHCGDGPCSFLTASKVNLPELSLALAIVPPDLFMPLSQLSQQAGAQIECNDRVALFSVRSHLVKQVLLI